MFPHRRFCGGISRGLKRELNQIGDELKEKLMLVQVSYDRMIKELLVHYRKSFPVPGELDEKPAKPKSRSRPKAQLGTKKPAIAT